MLQVFAEFKKNISLKKSVFVDNLIFQLHYRLTFWLLLTCTLLVSSRQYIGEHIRCISDTIASNVINTFCFFTTTFTVVKHLNSSNEIPHPGVGPLGHDDDEPIIRHAYYQWVPFVLFGQAVMFYFPHLLWRNWEGGTIKKLTSGLETGYLAYDEENVKDKPKELEFKHGKVPSRGVYFGRVDKVRRTFLQRLEINRIWGYKLMFCELLNAVNLLIQIMMTDAFLGGRFIDLGPSVIRGGDVDPLDVIFPKVTKCTFQKYGPSGTIQKHDALCVMALNVMNEKIYLFLWFWFVGLSVATLLALLWRFLTIILFRNLRFSTLVFSSQGKLNATNFEKVISQCEFSHWLFLYYLAKNVHRWALSDLIDGLAREIDENDKTSGFSPNGFRSTKTSTSDASAEDTVPLRSMPESLDVPDSISSDRPHQA